MDHPITGKPVSRQRAAQLINMERGMCINHSTVPIFEGTRFCEACLVKIRAIRPSMQRHVPKSEWRAVDWRMKDHEIAALLKVTTSAVLYQRKRAGRPIAPRPLRALPTRSLQDYLPLALKEQARTKFRDRVVRGLIKRQPCAVCGVAKTEGHHFDYTKPLEVIWLCKAHHMAVHRQINQTARRPKAPANRKGASK